MYGASGTATTPREYINELEEPRREQIQRLHDLIRKTAPTLDPYIQSGMLAYGRYNYRYASGREGEWFPVGLASNKRYISLYVNAANDDGAYLAGSYRDRLPKADIGKSCVRFKRLDDVDTKVLEELIRAAADRPFGAAVR